MPTSRNRFRGICCFRFLAGTTICTLAMGLLVALVTSSPGEEQLKRSKPAVADQMTLKKLADVEVQEYPWGSIRWTMNADIDANSKMTFGVVHIKPHQTNALHLHPKEDEILHVVAGSCEHRMGDKWVAMNAGDTIRIPHGIHHNARTKDEPCHVVVAYDTGQRQMVPVEE